MKARMGVGVEKCGRKSSEGLRSPWLSARLILRSPVLRISRTPPPQCQQPSSHHEQVGERCTCLKAVQVLRQPSIADLLKAEDPLDHADRVLDLRAHFGLGSILRLDRLVHPSAKAVTTV